MSALIPIQRLSPYNKTEECAQFIVGVSDEQFTLFDVMIVGQEYTFSFWASSVAAGSLIINDIPVVTGIEWTKHIHTFTANSTDIVFDFGVTGTYYIYHPQLEIGNMPTSWTPSPDDVEEHINEAQSSADHAQETANNATDRVSAAESTIKMLTDAISMMVTDGSGTSLMTQTKDGWTFNIQNLQDTVNDASAGVDQLMRDLNSTDAVVNVLQQAVDDLGVIGEYVRIQVYEDEPCIELGEGDSDFKLLITNTRIMFREGSATHTYVDTNGLVTDNITVNEELRQGGFVWVVRANGNYGLMWKGS